MKMWICRNKNGSLALFEDEPEYDDVWDWWNPSRSSSQNVPVYLNMMLFPEVTFENSPMEVELVLKKYGGEKTEG